MLILSGDIGATKTRIALVEVVADVMHIRGEATFVSANFHDAQAIITHAIQVLGIHPNMIGLGVAGPVRDQCSEPTNLPWRIDSRALELAFALPKVHIINDLEAVAWGIPALNATECFELHAGRPDLSGNLAIIAAGTGLGEAGICRYAGGFYPFPSEGGHTDFAPANLPIEWALLQFLAKRYGHVSWERVVSGLGIPDILEFLCQYRNDTLSTVLYERLAKGDKAAVIAAAAEMGECALCEETMRLFVRMYGREAGNHALKIMATGGVYLAGGIAPKIMPLLRTSGFLDEFFKKGRMRSLMLDMPVRVITSDKVALYGAATAALRHL